MQFNTANDVRKFLKDHGFTAVKVRLVRNPFGGDDKFAVKLTDIPDGVAVGTKSGSKVSTTFFSSDNGVTAGRVSNLKIALAGTNAFAEA